MGRTFLTHGVCGAANGVVRRFQFVSEPDSKSSMTNIPSVARIASFGPSSHAVKKRLSAADRISAPATAALLRFRIVV
jgi:hypothetical protein